MAKRNAEFTATSRGSRATRGTKLTPHAEFRPDPNRAVFVTGQFDQNLVNRLTPEIIRLQHESREPISVYIDSPGGLVYYMRNILRLLRLPTLDSPEPCRIITVATTFAGSAAAILLCSGDYVIAYPDSVIHFHGVRTYRQTEITKEDADDVARDLKASNDDSAVALARSRSQQFFFRFVTLRSDFEEYRKGNPRAITDKDCFVEMVSARLSKWGKDLVRKAEDRYKRYDNLSGHIQKSRRLGRLITTGDYAKVEAEI